MEPRYFVLSVVAGCPNGIVPGRTVLQKLGYFCSTALDLGVKYRPHFFGPYSMPVADATDRMEALGYLNQVYSKVGGSVRHDYQMTAEGEQLYDKLKETLSDMSKISSFVQALTSAPGWDDAQVVSWAAKVDYILRKAGEPVTREAIAKEAGELGWKVEEPGIREEVTDFLVSMALVKAAC